MPFPGPPCPLPSLGVHVSGGDLAAIDVTAAQPDAAASYHCLHSVRTEALASKEVVRGILWGVRLPYGNAMSALRACLKSALPLCVGRMWRNIPYAQADIHVMPNDYEYSHHI